MEFEFLRPEDKPALLGLSNPEFLTAAQSALAELGYKVHSPDSHEDFLTRFTQVPYQVVVLEDCFQCNSPEENTALRSLQVMPMPLRRHTTIVLIGAAFGTLNAMQAFQHSVHAVASPLDLSSLAGIIQKAVSDSTAFMNVYFETQRQMNATK